MNAYLFGDKYSIHPIHFGRLFLFLKNPENKVIGNIIIGTTADIDFASNTTLPISIPNDEPDKPIKTKIK